MEQRSEALQAPGVQVEWGAHEGLVEQAEVTAVLNDRLHRSKPFQVYDLNSTQQQTDPLLQPVGLLLQAAVDGQLLEQLQTHQRPGQKQPEQPEQQEKLQHLGPLVVNVHGPQQDVARSVHPRLVGEHNSVSCRRKSSTA